ncbi:glutamate racemase [Marichromatium gracile]|uniref:glutamate racemase n=1 Tax=Marichromatium gracile TaxID=1048 RepID=UPI001F241490|nr:glutamate racemase [Marichromatium gracile]MCF1182694.1 glutamate racemase [Marichromatium gracile]
MIRQQPIGVFDSGVGGLSVLREIRRELPGEDLLYVADSAHAPYGDKPTETIETRSLAVAEFLIAQGAKAIVIACNTATGVAARVLRARHALPVVAMEPAVKPAAARTRSGRVGVLATRQTLASANFARLRTRVAGQAEVLAQPCPGLVERIEQGDLDGPLTRALLEGYLAPLLERGVDTLVLGCTHYPHLRPLIERLAGPEVAVLDSGAGVARQVRRRLAEAALLAPLGRVGGERFWTSGELAQVAPLIARLWPGAPPLAVLPEPIESGVSLLREGA